MLRTSLLVLALATIPLFAQTIPTVQQRIAAQQDLIRALNSDLSRYKPTHPDVGRTNSLIDVLAAESRLLQQAPEQRPQATVEHQRKALAMQLAIMRDQVANYKPGHPMMDRSRAIVDVLEAELRSLGER